MMQLRYCSRKLRGQILRGYVTPWIDKHPRRERLIRTVLAHVEWFPEWKYALMICKARMLTTSTGIPHTIDHVIPLLHPYVCGLSVLENLEVVPWGRNQYKSNRWNEDQLEFDL